MTQASPGCHRLGGSKESVIQKSRQNTKKPGALGGTLKRNQWSEIRRSEYGRSPRTLLCDSDGHEKARLSGRRWGFAVRGQIKDRLSGRTRLSPFCQLYPIFVNYIKNRNRMTSIAVSSWCHRKMSFISKWLYIFALKNHNERNLLLLLHLISAPFCSVSQSRVPTLMLRYIIIVI